MIIIKRGHGWVVIIFCILAALAMNAITRAAFGKHYYQQNAWPKFGTFILAAIACTAYGLYLRRKPTVKSGEDFFGVESAHHLFFVPVLYWGPLLFLLGVLYLAYAIFGPGWAVD